MLVTMAFTAGAQADYYVKHGSDVNVTHGTHYPEGYSADYSNLFRIDVVDTETGIGEVKGENGKVKGIYDFQGRKVEQPSTGIYIIDGKKVLVR